MSDTTPAPREQIGGNAPPPDQRLLLEPVTPEMLTAENVDLAKRIDACLASVTWTEITSDEEAVRAGDVIVRARALWVEADEARSTRKRPFLDVTNTIDRWWRPRIERIEGFGVKLKGMIDLRREKKAADARKEQARLDAEAERARKTAQITLNAAERAPEVRGAPAELVADRHFDRSAELTRQAELTTAKSLVSESGTRIGTKLVWKALVDDYEKAVIALLKIAPDKIKKIIDEVAQAQARGGTRVLDGVTIKQIEETDVRRR